jgi:hypothetical protein
MRSFVSKGHADMFCTVSSDSCLSQPLIYVYECNMYVVLYFICNALFVCADTSLSVSTFTFLNDRQRN